jgi:hypothetical protein
MNVREPIKPVADYVILSGCLTDFVLARASPVQNVRKSCRNGAMDDKLDRLSLLSSGVELSFYMSLSPATGRRLDAYSGIIWPVIEWLPRSRGIGTLGLRKRHRGM